MVLGVRLENLVLSSQGIITGATLSAPIEAIEPLGADTLVYFRVGETLACARVEPHATLKVGETAHFAPEMNSMHLLDGETGLTI